MSSPEDRELGQFIALHYHYQLLSDNVRIGAFKSALSKVVPMGGSVLELGSGTGVLSFFAAQRAARVIAIEYNSALVHASRTLLERNGVADRVTVIKGDAREFTPVEPVDLVICEMLHSALLREKQLEVIDKFKIRYMARFGNLPHFMPEATLLAAQLVYQDYDFHGYHAAVPFFQSATNDIPATAPASDAQSYAVIDYIETLPERFETILSFAISDSVDINAVRFITKNLLVILPAEQRSIDWHNQYLVLPLATSLRAQSGSTVEIRFAYDAGGPIEQLSESLHAELKDG